MVTGLHILYVIGDIHTVLHMYIPPNISCNCHMLVITDSEIMDTNDVTAKIEAIFSHGKLCQYRLLALSSSTFYSIALLPSFQYFLISVQSGLSSIIGSSDVFKVPVNINLGTLIQFFGLVPSKVPVMTFPYIIPAVRPSPVFVCMCPNALASWLFGLLSMKAWNRAALSQTIIRILQHPQCENGWKRNMVSRHCAHLWQLFCMPRKIWALKSF